MNLFVAKLSSSTTDGVLQETFSAYGEVSSAKVIIDRHELFYVRRVAVYASFFIGADEFLRGGDPFLCLCTSACSLRTIPSFSPFFRPVLSSSRKFEPV